jgi:hypothetical protein
MPMPPVSPAAIEARHGAGLALVGGDERAAQPPVAWGGPRIELGDLQSPWAPPFVLDDPAEEVDWRNFQATVGDVASGLGTSLRLLSDAVPAHKVR